MMRTFLPSPLLAAALATMLVTPARADELGDKGREIFDKHRHAIVTVQIVSKMKFGMEGFPGGEATESKQDLSGTVIDASGLTVLALSACEPGDLMQQFMDGASDEETKFKVETELGEVKILLDDGTELPAEIVLRDKELDLAFVRPRKKPAQDMRALDFTKPGKARVLDHVITLDRLGQVAGRAYAATVERIAAVVQKPRLFYVPSSEAPSLGCPAFGLDGTLLGVYVMRTTAQKNAGMGMFSTRIEGMTPIILPADEILKASRQAPPAKSGPDKPTEPDPAKEKAGAEKK